MRGGKERKKGSVVSPVEGGEPYLEVHIVEDEERDEFGREEEEEEGNGASVVRGAWRSYDTEVEMMYG